MLARHLLHPTDFPSNQFQQWASAPLSCLKNAMRQVYYRQRLMDKDRKNNR